MASGVIPMSSGKAWKGKIVWISEANIAGNCSTVHIEVYTWKTDGYATSGGGWFGGSAYIGESESSQIKYEQEDKNYDEDQDGHNPILRVSHTATVPHNNDGSGQVYIAASITKGYSTSLANTTLSGSEVVTLDVIPKTSSFAATDAAIGSVSTITIYRESTALYHRIKAQFGTVVGYITNEGGFSYSEATITGTSVAFTIPESFYYVIPDSQTGICTLTLYTVSGGVIVGDEVTTTIEITTVSSRCNPTLTISVTHDNSDTEGLTGSNTAYIRGYSDARCAVSATGRYGATIRKIWTSGTYTDNGDGTYTISPVNSDTITFYAQDSRGYTGQVSTTVVLVPYVVLTNNSSAGRPNPTDGSAYVQFQGQYFNSSFGVVENTLSIKYRIEYPDGYIDPSWTVVSPTISEESYYAYVPLNGFSYTEAFKIHTIVQDRLLTLERTVLLKQGIPVFDWGKYDFQFHVPVYIQGRLVDVPQTIFSSPEYAGTSGDVVLSEDVSNFEYLEIFFNDDNGRYCNSLRVNNPEGKQVCLATIEPKGSLALYLRRSGYVISGNRITYEGNGGYAYFNGASWTPTTGNFIRITKVIGHNRTTVAAVSNMYAAIAAMEELE